MPYNFQTFQTNILVTLFIMSIDCCPFQNQTDALISSEYPIQKNSFQIYSGSDTIGSAQIVGFWSLCIPQLEMKTFPTIGDLYDKTKSDDGQLLILFSDEQQIYRIVGFLSIDQVYFTISHKFIFFGEDNQEQQLSFEFPLSNYEGEWVFTFFTFQPGVSQITIESSQNTKKSVSYKMEENQFNVFLGGRGKIFDYNLNIFRGQISNLITSGSISYNDNLFQYYLKLCAIPKLYSGEQIVEIVKGLKIFDYDNVLQSQFQQLGYNFCLAGWIKFNFQKLLSQNTYPLLRISTRKNYFNQVSEGDELFQIYVTIEQNKPESTKYTVVKDYHILPILQKFSQQQFSKIETISHPTELGLKYFQGLQEWHFIKYEYGKQEQIFSSTLQILFYSDLGFIQHKSEINQFINSMYFIFVGGDQFYKNKFSGSIYDLKFFHNYLEPKDPSLLKCHYSCLQCNGPLDTNCVSCQDVSFRVYLQEQNKCECVSGYFDIGVGACTEFQVYFKTVIQYEIDKQTELIDNCQYQYFYFPLNNGSFQCLKCPEIMSEGYLCLDCLLNPKEWYLQPICQYDLIVQDSNNQFAYMENNRETNQKDVYFINEVGLLTLHPEFQDFCDSLAEENCIQAKSIHLGIYPFVKCKQNYYISNRGECVNKNPFCLLVDSSGNCVETVDGIYNQNDTYFQCPYFCSKCYLDQNTNNVVCQSCIERHSLIEGECKQCGDNCQYCITNFDKKKKKNYLMCLKCINDSQYFVSFDSQNCLKNSIANCDYAFHAYKDDYTVNTFEFQYQPIDYQILQDKVAIICAKCADGYLYLLDERQCIPGLQQNCYVGLAQNINQIQNQICIYQDITISVAVSMLYKQYCAKEVSNCAICILNRFSTYQCLECQDGFFADLSTMKCYACPASLNCFSCFQQQKYYEDEWKVNIRPFYKMKIEQSNVHSYNLYAQSQNLDDYEVVCSICKSGYEKYKKQCIKECPSSCLQCEKINNQNVCIKCAKEINGRKLSLQNNECIQCPQNCALCYARTPKQISNINLLFNNDQYKQYSYYCLKSFDNQRSYYDQQINNYITCQKFEKCQKIFQIPISLSCSNQIGDGSQQNIFIDDLVSESSFAKFENDFFYLEANQKQISKIIIIINSEFEQTCAISGTGVITQQFSKNIFSVNSVEIEFNFTKNVTFQIQNSLTIANFTKISITGLIIKPIINSNYKQFSFFSALNQVISLRKVYIIYENKNIQDQLQFRFQNIVSLEIDELIIKNMFQLYVDYTFLVKETSLNKKIQIRNLKLLDSNLQNQEFFQFHQNENDKIEFDNINIYSNFVNASFFNLIGTNQNGLIKFSNTQLVSTLKNSKFLNLEGSQSCELLNILIQKSALKNSTLFLLNNKASIQTLSIENCLFQEDSFALMNSQNLLPSPINIELLKIYFLQNKYHQFAKFVSFQRYKSEKSQIIFNYLQISDNFIYNISNDFNTKDITASVFYLQVDHLILSDLYIERGYGIVDVSLHDIMNIYLLNVTIYQGQKYKFLGLHQFLDCQLQQVQGLHYDTSILIFAVQNLQIENIKIQNAQSYNAPIISIISEEIITKQVTETIKIKQLRAEHCLLLITQSETITSLLMIKSQQQSIIVFENITFMNNILHHYVQDQLHPSGLLLYIDSYLGKTAIKNSNFFSNIILNSTDSINYISCQQLIIENCIFDSNNLFNYTIIQPYLLWGYIETIYEEDIRDIFKIQSDAGNGLFIIQNLNISNCKITKSQGQNGAGFKIEPQQQSEIVLDKVIFENIQNTFISEVETGGCLTIDGTSSQTLKLLIQNISVKSIFSRYLGGFLHIQAGNGQVDIQLNKIRIIDTYSQIGSLLSVYFSDQLNKSQVVSVKNIIASYTEEGILNYFDQYSQKTLGDSEKYRLLNNKTLFYFENAGIISLQDITLLGIQYQSAIKASNILKLIICNLEAFNFQAGNHFIYIQPYAYLENEILISNLNIKVSQIQLMSVFTSCQEINQVPITNQFKCLPKSQTIQSPQTLIFRSLNNHKNFAKCLLQEQNSNIDLISSGFIQFMQLNKYTKFSILNSQLSEIFCTKCELGLLYFDYIEKVKYQSIDGLYLGNSQCGLLGCLNIIYDAIVKNESRILQTQERNFFSLTQERNLSLTYFEFDINNYTCLSSSSYSGTCLYVKNTQILLRKSSFLSNTAQSKGGAIYFEGENSLVAIKCIIEKNLAGTGGGIYFENQNSLEFLKLNTIVKDNFANLFGNNVVSRPDKLILLFGQNENYFPTLQIASNKTFYLGQTLIQDYQFNEETYKEFFLPSGQEISSYEIFDWKQKKYAKFGKFFRIIPVNNEGELMKNLNNSYCEIKSRLYNLLSKDEGIIFTNNYTNFQTIQFNDYTQDYNLDNLIIYFDNELPKEIILQLQFNCSSVFTPKYSQNYPYLIESYHNNYNLRVNIRSFACQLGEIKNYTDYSCKPCDSQQGLFSLKINSISCEVKDDISTLNVTSAQLNLKSSFWRPYLDSNYVSYCSNLIENCEGGWIEGDASCFQGHIGALCEQCDLYNIRGEGSYSISKKYQCGNCNDQNLNIIVLILISFWTIISIFITVQSNTKAVTQDLKIIKLYSAFLRKIITLEQNQSSIVIKMLTNYFQIISVISTFELNIPKQLQNLINAVGSPISTIVNSSDCFLIEFFSIEIIYVRIVWQLIMPFLYLFFFIITYLIGAQVKLMKFQRTFLSTSLIYMYIYMQQNIIGGLIELLSYREVSGFKWVLANVAYRYDTETHYQWILKLILPMLLLFAIVIPLYFFCCLYKNRKELDDKQVRFNWGYLYNEYKKEAYFWEIVKIFQKQLIIIFLNYYQQNIALKASILSIILIIYLEFNRKFSPFLINQLNKLDYYQTHICLSSYMLALGIYQSQQLNSNQISLIFGILLFIINVNLLFILISKIVVEYIYSKMKKETCELYCLKGFITRYLSVLKTIKCINRFLNDGVKQKDRVKKRYQKLKLYLMAQAKSILALKSTSSLFMSDSRSKINSDVPQSLVFSYNGEEKQFNEGKLQQSSYSYMLSKNEVYSPIGSVRTIDLRLKKKLYEKK